MKYVKPEVVVLASAVDAIQSTGIQKPTGMHLDSPVRLTVTAYEADE